MPQLYDGTDNGRHHQRKPTLPFAHSTRQKPRRWPLVFRFIKGAIHAVIILPVLLHAVFAAGVVFADQKLDGSLGLPASIIPSLSIVVGLMLVFRNNTCYNRFWDGRNHITTIITSIRNLTRSFLACSALALSASKGASAATGPNAPDRADTERAVRILIAILHATKNHLRAEWGAEVIAAAPNSGGTPSTSGSTRDPGDPTTTQSLSSRARRASGIHERRPSDAEYADLLPAHFKGLDDRGVGLPLQLTYFLESHIKRSSDLGVFHAPHASQLTVQVNTLVASYGAMETIRLTGIPVAHLIHQKQVLALFGCVLPFALVDDMGWWTVIITVLVCFTLYGIDGIASQLEDPFGMDRNDIKMDVLVEDVREEVMALLDEWRRVVGREGGEMFIGKAGGGARDAVSGRFRDR